MCSVGVYSGWVCICDCECVCVCVCVCVWVISLPLLNPDAGHFQILWANNLDTLPSLALVLSFSSSEWSKPVAFMSVFPTSLWAWEPEFCPSASETALHFWFWRNSKVTWFPTNSSPSFLQVKSMLDVLPVFQSLAFLQLLPVTQPFLWNSASPGLPWGLTLIFLPPRLPFPLYSSIFAP